MLITQISVFIENQPGKLGEVTQVLADNGVDQGEELLLQRDLGVQIDVDETGATFAENARLKADAGRP